MYHIWILGHRTPTSNNNNNNNKKNLKSLNQNLPLIFSLTTWIIYTNSHIYFLYQQSHTRRILYIQIIRVGEKFTFTKVLQNSIFNILSSRVSCIKDFMSREGKWYEFRKKWRKLKNKIYIKILKNDNEIFSLFYTLFEIEYIHEIGLH